MIPSTPPLVIDSHILALTSTGYDTDFSNLSVFPTRRRSKIPGSCSDGCRIRPSSQWAIPPASTSALSFSLIYCCTCITNDTVHWCFPLPAMLPGRFGDSVSGRKTSGIIRIDLLSHTSLVQWFFTDRATRPQKQKPYNSNSSHTSAKWPSETRANLP